VPQWFTQGKEVLSISYSVYEPQNIEQGIMADYLTSTFCGALFDIRHSITAAALCHNCINTRPVIEIGIYTHAIITPRNLCSCTAMRMYFGASGVTPQ
jgi:hypothetical protein